MQHVLGRIEEMSRMMLRPDPERRRTGRSRHMQRPAVHSDQQRRGVDERRQRLGIARPVTMPQLVRRARTVDAHPIGQWRTTIPIEDHRNVTGLKDDLAHLAHQFV